jgi:hypothetical protein
MGRNTEIDHFPNLIELDPEAVTDHEEIDLSERPRPMPQNMDRLRMAFRAAALKTD